MAATASDGRRRQPKGPRGGPAAGASGVTAAAVGARDQPRRRLYRYSAGSGAPCAWPCWGLVATHRGCARWPRSLRSVEGCPTSRQTARGGLPVLASNRAAPRGARPRGGDGASVGVRAHPWERPRCVATARAGCCSGRWRRGRSPQPPFPPTASRGGAAAAAAAAGAGAAAQPARARRRFLWACVTPTTLPHRRIRTTIVTSDHPLRVRRVYLLPPPPPPPPCFVRGVSGVRRPCSLLFVPLGTPLLGETVVCSAAVALCLPRPHRHAAPCIGGWVDGHCQQIISSHPPPHSPGVVVVPLSHPPGGCGRRLWRSWHPPWRAHPAVPPRPPGVLPVQRPHPSVAGGDSC